MRSIPSHLLTAKTGLRVTVLALASVLLAGCASYGSFDENEPGLEESLLGGVIGVLGSDEREEPIDYSARAPLVAPPSTAALPAPRDETIAANNPEWPTGSRQRMAEVLASEDQTLVFSQGATEVDLAATQALAERSGTAPVTRATSDNSRLSLQEMERERQIEAARVEAAAAQAANARQGRRFLTDPPAGTRVPSPDAPYGAPEEAEDEGGGGWWPF